MRYRPSPDLLASTWPNSVLKVIIIIVESILIPILLEDYHSHPSSENQEAKSNEDGYQNAKNFYYYHRSMN